MNKLEVEAFLSICRHHSISKAAEELYINQSSLSTRLKTLEERIGCPLLLRGKGKREITLTAQGQAFYKLALRYMELIDKMDAVGKGNMITELRVSVINSVGNYLMPPVFQKFAETYPDIHLSVQDMEAEMASSNIIRGKTDIAFSTANVETDQISSAPFIHDPFTVICSADAPYPDKVTLEDLPPRDEIYIKWSMEYNFWHQTTFGDHHAQYALELMGQIPLFVSLPGKWAIVPKSVANQLCASGELRQCTPDFHIPDRSIYILRHRSSGDSAYIHYFLETVKEVLKEPYGDYFLL